jgi:hypothetical protein
MRTENNGRIESNGRAEAGWPGTATGTASVSGAGRRSQDDHYGMLPASAPATRRATVGDTAEDSPAGRRSAETIRPGSAQPATPAGETPMRPGDVEQTRITLWDDETTRQFHDEWHEVKAQFVDDPVAALTRAHDLLTAAVHELTESLLAERDDLDPLRRTSTPDTESMRMAMRGYREFLDRILAL